MVTGREANERVFGESRSKKLCLSYKHTHMPHPGALRSARARSSAHKKKRCPPGKVPHKTKHSGTRCISREAKMRMQSLKRLRRASRRWASRRR